MVIKKTITRNATCVDFLQSMTYNIAAENVMKN